MISQKNEFSTVLLVSKNGGETRSIRVKTRHLKRWKIYLGVLCFTILSLTAAIVILSGYISEHNRERSILIQKISKLEHEVPYVKDTLKAKTYIQGIETKLKKINDYLLKRGIKGFSKDFVGGNDNEPVKLSPTEIYAYYDDRVKDILYDIAYIPIGYSSESPVMTSGFGYRTDPFKPGTAEFHSGLDFRGHKGDNVKATADGEVVHAGWQQGYGKCIQIKHKYGYETLYGHLSRILVYPGQKIHAGDIIGYMGSTGHSTGTHLHYEVRKDHKPVNPVNFLRLN